MTPKVGDIIYVGSAYYLSHGMDDFEGGKAKISKVYKSMSAGKMVDFVEVEENPGCSYNWEFLRQEQDKLQKQFGEQIAHPDPDDREEFNRWD